MARNSNECHGNMGRTQAERRKNRGLKCSATRLPSKMKRHFRHRFVLGILCIPHSQGIPRDVPRDPRISSLDLTFLHSFLSSSMPPFGAHSIPVSGLDRCGLHSRYHHLGSDMEIISHALVRAWNVFYTVQHLPLAPQLRNRAVESR